LDGAQKSFSFLKIFLSKKSSLLVASFSFLFFQNIERVGALKKNKLCNFGGEVETASGISSALFSRKNAFGKSL